MEKLFDVPIEDVFSAYYDCRRHKRNTAGAMAFELDLEANLVRLWEDLCCGAYRILPSTVFIVERPVRREIFAANFRDRIVHHLLLMYLNPCFERNFIYDTYSCRVGKGTHFGVRRINRFIRQCSENGRKPCWVLKLDVQSFFMSIDKRILHKRVLELVERHYHQDNVGFVRYLLDKIIWNDPTKNCVFHSPKSKWDGLPLGKSLFHGDTNHGLPIGNFTSQVFANFYLSPLDHFLKHHKKVAYYGRYVDDFVLVHPSKAFLVRLVPQIDRFLRENLGLRLNPRKVYLQPHHHGVRFLGFFVKQGHIVANPRILRNFREAIWRGNLLALHHKPTTEERQGFISSVNSYLGILRHGKTYRLRTRILTEDIFPLWFKQIAISGRAEKITKKTRPSQGTRGAECQCPTTPR